MPIEPTSAQGKMLLTFLKSGGSLTVLKAINLLGIYALSQRCGELKKQGWPIKDEFVTCPSGKRVKEYWI